MAIMDAALKVPIISTLDDRGIRKAKSSLLGLESTAKKVLKTFGVAASAAAIVSFGKESVKAFLADDAAAKQLNLTLQNLGQGFADVQVEQFVAKMQDATGVLDDQLRPALAGLIAQTKDFAQAEKLLSVALDVSAGSGKDLAAVSTALGRAYQGNFASLAKLNVGISASEAKTLDFQSAVDKLMKTWGGASTLDTAARRFARLKVAGADAMESIGSGILDAFKNLSGGVGNIEALMKGIRNLGYVIGAEIAGLAEGIHKIGVAIMNDPILGPLIRGTGRVAKWIADRLGISKAIQADIAAGQAKSIANQKASTAEYKKTAAAANLTAAAAKKAAQAAAQKLVLDKASAVLNQAQKAFDLDQIQLAAAMAKKQTDEDRARLQLKKDILDLESAINEGNVTAAAKLAQSVVTDAQLLAQLRTDMIGLGDVPDPFAAWLKTLQQMANELARLAQIPVLSTTAGTPSWIDPRYTQGVSPAIMYPGALGLTPTSSVGDIDSLRYQAAANYYTQQTSAAPVNIQINPAVAGLIDVIQNSSASGVSPTVNRVSSSYIA